VKHTPRKNSSKSEPSSRLPIFTALFISVITLLCVYALWTQIKDQEDQAIRTVFNEEVSLLSNALGSELNYGVTAVERMAKRWNRSGGTPYEAWEEDALAYIDSFQSLTWVGWIDRNLIIQRRVPSEGNENVIGRSIDFDSPRREAYQLARETNRATVTPPLDLVDDERGMIVFVPLTTNGEFDGYLAGVYSTDKFLKSDLWQGVLRNINLRITDGEEVLIAADEDYANNSKWERVVNISALNRNWTMTASPKKSLIDANSYQLSSVTLILGGLLALLTGFATYAALHLREQNTQLKEQRLSRLRREKEKDVLVDKLLHSNEELARFAYICSHDLQEPLRMIRSFSQRLQMHLGTTLETDEKGQKYFRFITDGAERAQTLIQDILSYSQLDQTTKPLEAVDLNNLVKTIAENVDLHHPSQDRVIVSYDKLPIVHGNKSQLYQLLQNLVNNGLKYQAPNAQAKVHISAIELSGAWEFTVIDNGIGIAPEYQNQIFNVFKRLHRRTEYSGTGIGLAICKKVVERHGGEIWVKSEEGKGSAFAFTLPKRASNAAL
jgi:signal transduction histidine kinase